MGNWNSGDSSDDSDDDWCTAQELRELEVDNPIGFHFRANPSAVVSFRRTHFKDAICVYEGIQASFVFDACTWDNTTLIFDGTENTFTFDYCGLTNSNIVGEQHEFITDGNEVEDIVFSTDAGSIVFTQSTARTNLVITLEDPREDPVDASFETGPHVFKAHEAEELEIVDCKFTGDEDSNIVPGVDSENLNENTLESFDEVGERSSVVSKDIRMFSET